jgi:membrane-bound metal-dependent hydrolase YbcI (DUF457 family)
MALCFAHAAAGYLAYEAVRPVGRHRPALLAGAVLLAVGPDLDFLPGLAVGRPMLFHRGVSHTVLAALLVAVGVGAALWMLGRRRPIATALWAFAVWSSHLVLDWLTVDVVAPHGGRFLWPLSDAYLIAPLPVLPEVVIDPSGREAFFASLVTARTLAAWGPDVGVLLATVLVVRLLRAWRTVREPAIDGAVEGP